MTDTTPTATRRAALAVLAGTPFLAGTIAAAITSPAEAATIDRTAWDKAFAHYLRCKAEDEAHDAMLEPRYARFYAARDAIPHETVVANPGGDHLSRREMTTASRDDLMLATSVIETHPRKPSVQPDPEFDDFERACRDLLAAVKRRGAEEDRLRNEIVGDDDEDKAEALGQASYEARCALVKMPAPDAPALLWKLEYLFGDECDEEGGYSPSYSSAWMGAVMADARRLLSHGRA